MTTAWHKPEEKPSTNKTITVLLLLCRKNCIGTEYKQTSLTIRLGFYCEGSFYPNCSDHIILGWTYVPSTDDFIDSL